MNKVSVVGDRGHINFISDDGQSVKTQKCTENEYWKIGRGEWRPELQGHKFHSAYLEPYYDTDDGELKEDQYALINEGNQNEKYVVRMIGERTRSIEKNEFDENKKEAKEKHGDSN